MGGSSRYFFDWKSLLQLCFALFLATSSAGLVGDHHLLWSSQPLSEASISVAGQWEDVADTSISLSLPGDAQVFVSYNIPIRGIWSLNHQPTDIGSRFSGRQDILQVRVSIDGIPMRQSASHVSVGSQSGGNDSLVTSLRGHTVAELRNGSHVMNLQWKKTGHRLSSWRSKPSAGDGFVSGRVMVANARHKYLWSLESVEDDKLTLSNAWVDMKDCKLSFFLDSVASLRFTYSVMVRPEIVESNDAFGFRHDLSVRLSIDGNPIAESESSATTVSGMLASSQLSNSIAIDLGIGNHTVSLQWVKWGAHVHAWRSDPSFLDGYASSRFVAIFGEKENFSDVEYVHINGHALGGSAWNPLVDEQLSFHLYTKASVFFSYMLPAVLLRKANENEEYGVRVVVDGVAYAHSGETVDGTNSNIAARGYLTLQLEVGSHSASLQ